MTIIIYAKGRSEKAIIEKAIFTFENDSQLLIKESTEWDIILIQRKGNFIVYQKGNLMKETRIDTVIKTEIYYKQSNSINMLMDNSVGANDIFSLPENLDLGANAANKRIGFYK